MPRIPSKTPSYVEATGRRKTAVARVRLWPSGETSFIINAKFLEEYLRPPGYGAIATEPLEKGGLDTPVQVSVLVRGGGLHAQAQAIRQGIARALVKFDPELRGNLKALGFLTRDSRQRERKKFGLKRARRARQWRKR